MKVIDYKYYQIPLKTNEYDLTKFTETNNV